jgi:uncharacterized protein YoxC
LLFAVVEKAADEPSRQLAATNAPYLLLRAPMLQGHLQLANATLNNVFNVVKSLSKAGEAKEAKPRNLAQRWKRWSAPLQGRTKEGHQRRFAELFQKTT